MREIFPRQRQFAWLAASFSIGVSSWLIISVLLQGFSVGDQNRENVDEVDFEKEVDKTVPQPTLAPEDVVNLQVHSIRDAVQDISRLKVCYSLASPGNRSSTGPFSRFAVLVMKPPYDRLALCSDWQLGSTFVDRNLAAVLVTTISAQGEVSGFRFVLQRQDFPQPDCWLTESVQFIPDGTEGFKATAVREVDSKIE